MEEKRGWGGGGGGPGLAMGSVRLNFVSFSFEIVLHTTVCADHVFVFLVMVLLCKLHDRPVCKQFQSCLDYIHQFCIKNNN